MTEPQASRQFAFENALAELRAGRIERAEVLCERILDSAPQDPAAHQLAATIALRSGRLDEAARWAKSSLALRPDHAPTLMVAARVARAAGDLRQAGMWSERAGCLTPDRPEPAFLACVMLIESNDGKARSVFEDLLMRFPNFVDGWREIGEALRKAGQPKAAVLAFARAAESSADPMDHARLGAALQAVDRPREAIVAFRRALAAAPDLAEARAALGSCLRQTGELQLARAELERAVTLRPQRRPRLVRARACLRRLARYAGRDPGLSPVHRGAARHSGSPRQPGAQSAKLRRSRRRDGFLSARDAASARHVRPHRPGADVGQERPPLAELSSTAARA